MTVEHTITSEELKIIVNKMLTLALEQEGVTDAEVGGAASAGITARVRLNEVDVIEFHRDKSLGITVYKGNRKGSASITDLTAPAMASAVLAACRIAQYTEEDPAAGLADAELLVKNIPDLSLHHASGITPLQAIANAKDCEAAALNFSKEITNSEGAAFSTNDQFYVYGNSRGLLAAYPATTYSAFCVVIGKRMDSMQRDYDFTVARDLNDLARLEDIGKNAAQKTLARLGAKKIKTCQAPVLMIPKIAVSFWSALVSAISGGALFRKSSFLLDSLDTKIFPDFLNIAERPHIHKGLGSAPFDDDGVATRDKDIIKDGVLRTYLLGSYSARKLGMQTTANAGGIHNMIVQGMHEYKDLLKQMHTGLLVTELMGQGTNIVTGDYSRGASGFWVENGEITYPVEEITIAGNLKDMFATVVATGKDIDVRSNIRTGSVLLENMTIAGA